MLEPLVFRQSARSLVQTVFIGGYVAFNISDPKPRNIHKATVRDRDWLIELIPKIADFLRERLKLELHPNKLFIKTLASGVDFLGWVHFPDHRVLRTATKKHVLRAVNAMQKPGSLQSYLGLLRHGNAYKIEQKLYDENYQRHQ